MFVNLIPIVVLVLAEHAEFNKHGIRIDFRFNGEPAAAVIPRTADCYSCHRDHGAVDTTFVQFYPTLMEVARSMGTVKPTYDPNHKVAQ